jgi:hypothetical protein
VVVEVDVVLDGCVVWLVVVVVSVLVIVFCFWSAATVASQPSESDAGS